MNTYLCTYLKFFEKDCRCIHHVFHGTWRIKDIVKVCIYIQTFFCLIWTHKLRGVICLTQTDVYTCGHAHTLLKHASRFLNHDICSTSVKVNIVVIFPGGRAIKISSYNAGNPSSIPGSRSFPWRRKWQTTPVFLLGKFHGQSSLAATTHRIAELDMTEQLNTHTALPI